jgi:hypothetical protein
VTTALLERPVPVPHPDETTTPPKRRRDGGTVVLLALLLISAWIAGGFWVSVDFRSPRAPYIAPTASQPWIRSPEGGPRAFFRLGIPLTTLPDSATLWVEGDQEVTAYVNGYRVNVPPQPPDHLVDTPPNLFRYVATLDLRAVLTRHKNVLGLEVVNLDNRPPAFKARVVLRYGANQVVLGTQPADWVSTTNVALTSQVVPESGTFSAPYVADGSWLPAVAAAQRAGSGTVTVAPDAYTTPPTAPALAGAAGTRDLTASTTVTLPNGCDEGWIRVAATGPYVVSLDGSPIATGAGGRVYFGNPDRYALAHPPLVYPLDIYDICPVVHGGANLLSVEVSSAATPMIYLDGEVRSGSTTATFATGQGWRSGPQGGVGRTGGPEPNLVADPQASLGADFQTEPAALSVPGRNIFLLHLRLAAELLALPALMMLMFSATGRTLRTAVRGVLAGALPAVGIALFLSEFRHIVSVQPPFPDTPAMLDLIIGVWCVGLVGTFVIAGWRRPMRVLQPASNLAHDSWAAWFRPRWHQIAIVVVAFGSSLVQSYHLGFEPIWQDEAASLLAAQGIRHHIIPKWPSGFVYWKSELYSAVIAVVGGITHDDISWLRAVSIFFLGGTILLFGLKLAPLVLRGRRVYQFLATVVFATAPIELSHARDIRMYQMVQFFVVLLAVVLLKAVREPTTKRVVGTMAVLVAMYLSHEESFGALLLVPLVLFAVSGIRWMRNWRWWVFGGAAGAIIATQLALAAFTHPPGFGVDGSGGPLLAWSPAPYFYIQYLFFPSGQYGGELTVVSWLAVLAVVVAIRRRDVERLYVASFWIVPILVVAFLIYTKNTRYGFIVLPFVFLLGIGGLADVLDFLKAKLTEGVPRGLAVGARVSVLVLGILATAAIVLSLTSGLPDYGPLMGPLFGANISHSQLDYPRAVAYVKAHLRPGDAIIAACPTNLVGVNLGHPPTYWLPYQRGAVLLYLIEKHGQAVDTQYGTPAILNVTNFERAIDSHPRTWLVVPDGYVAGLLPGTQTLLESRFRLVEDGETVSVFLSTN